MTRGCTRRALLVLLAASVLSGCGARSRVPGPLPASPDFELTALDGTTLRLSADAGAVRLVDIWATWCAPCVREIPVLEELRKEYGPRGLKIYGLSTDDSPEIVRGFLRSRPVGYPVAMATQDVLDRLGFRETLPVIVLIDRQGRVARRHEGYTEGPVLRRDIEELLSP